MVVTVDLRGFLRKLTVYFFLGVWNIPRYAGFQEIDLRNDDVPFGDVATSADHESLITW